MALERVTCVERKRVWVVESARGKGSCSWEEDRR